MLALVAGAAVAYSLAQGGGRDREAWGERDPGESVAVGELPKPAGMAAAATPTANQPVIRPLATSSGQADEEVLLMLLSVPDPAVVYREADGVRLGTTPLPVKARRGQGEAAFILRRTGYHSERIAVPVLADQEALVTLRARPPAAPARAPAPAAPDAKADGQDTSPAVDNKDGDSSGGGESGR